MNRKKSMLGIVLWLLFALCLAGPVGAADDYIGDTAIYSAEGTSGVQPNVLILVDNSAATMNIASGLPYDPTEVYADQGFQPYYIYVGDNQGDFSRIELVNATLDLENLTCDKVIVKNALQENGTYSGAGVTDFPNLNGGACATGPKGATYALGNYLNYANATAEASSEEVVHHSFSYTYLQGSKWRTVTVDENYELLQTHVSVAADNEPGRGANWGDYWTVTRAAATSEWEDNHAYSRAAAFSGSTQRDIVYEALETVVGGARYAVNFASMVYGDNNSGGKILSPMQNLSDDTDFANFLNLLPGSGDTSSEPILSSATLRPQAEALYDAGYYFGAASDYITESTRIDPDIAKNCYNHIIIVTNGLSNGDGSPKLAQNIGDADNDSWPDEYVYGAGSHYLDDVAAWLKDNMGMTVHFVLAFQSSDMLVEGSAYDGGGVFYNVYDSNSLANAMTELLASIVAEVNSAFVAPVVPTSPENRTYSGSRVYLGFFKPVSQSSWYGNLKKYGLDSSSNIIDALGNIATNSDGGFKDTEARPTDTYTATSMWSVDAAGDRIYDGGRVEYGGSGSVMRKTALSSRNVYTYLGSNADLTHATNEFDTTNAGVTAALLGVDAAERDKVIDYILGVDSYASTMDLNGNGTADNIETRDWILGDVLHSKPQVVNYNTYTFTDENEANCSVNTSMVFVGANDGMLHAFKDCDGSEAWAFIPPDQLDKLSLLHQTVHNYFVDGTPVSYVYDKDNDGNIEVDDGDKVLLIFGERRGGSAYYALDVTVPDTPKFLWRIDSTVAGFSEMGESWSTPELGLVKHNVSGTLVDKVVAFIGAGYDNLNEDGRFGATQGFTNANVVVPTHDADDVVSTGTIVPPRNNSDTNITNNPKGRAVYAVEIAKLSTTGVPDFTNSGSLVWEFGYNGTDNTYNRKRMKFSVPSDVTVLDTDFDGYTDRLYVGDTGGQLWRMTAYQSSGELRPIASPEINTWFGKRIFEANARGTNDASLGTPPDEGWGRKFFYRPSVTFESGGVINLYIGSGDRAHPLNTNVVDRMYAIYDRGQRTNELITELDLVDVTDNILQSAEPMAYTGDCSNAADQSVTCVLERLYSTSTYGWYIKLDENPGEKVLANPLAFNKVAYYTTYAPNLEVSPDPCMPGNLGISRMYATNYKTGEAVLNFSNETNTPDSNNDEESTANNDRAQSKSGDVLRRADRSTELGVGIPSGLVMVMPASGDAEILVGCGGGLCSEDPVTGGTVLPVYWLWRR